MENCAMSFGNFIGLGIGLVIGVLIMIPIAAVISYLKY